MAYDGSIRINTKIDGKGFNSGIKTMMSSLGGLAAAFGVAFSVAGMVNFGKKSVETAMQMEAGWQGLRYMANAYGKDLGHIKEFLNEFTEDGLVPMMNAQQAYKNMLARGYSTDQLEKMLLVMKDSSVYLRKGQLSIGDAIEKTTMGLRTERSILTDSAGIEKNMYKMWQAYAEEMGTTISALTHEQKLIAEFQGFMEEGAVYAGAAAEYTETYAGKVAQLTAAMVGLKVSVGNMIIPLLNAILPKIIAMVKWFTYWFNIIGRVMNLLFGTQVGASSLDGVADSTYEAADAQDELADATGRAGKAAKGALASFDKLNVLAQPAAASGSGGGEVGLPVEEEGLFPGMEESLDEMEEKLRGFVTRVKEFFAPLGKAFDRLGKSLGKLKDAVVGAFEKFFPGGIDFRPFIALVRDGVIFIIDLLAKAIEGLANWINENPDAFKVLLKIFAGLAIAAAAVLAPASLVIAAVVALIAALGWLANNWDLVKEKAIEVWEKIKEVAISVWEKIVEVWGVVADWFNEKVIEPIKAFFAPIVEWFSTNVTNPLKEKFANLVEKWTELKDVIKEKVIDPLVNFFEKILKPLITAVLDFLKDYFAKVWKGIKDVISVVIGAIGLIFQTQLEFWKGIFSGVFEAIGGIIKGALQVITAVIGSVIDVIAGIITFLTGVFTGDWDKAWQGIKDIVIGIWDGIVGVIKGAINRIIGFINGMISGIVGGINAVIGLLNKLHFDIPDWIPEFGGQSFGFNIAKISAPQIPLLATGAVIPPNAPFAAILGDQKSGTNIEAPLKTIEQAVDNVLARRGMNTSADSGLIHNVIKLDGQVLYDAFKKIDKRVGTSLVAGSGIR